MRARDIEIINRNADWLNAEAEDVLEYQAPWDIHDAEDILPEKRKAGNGSASLPLRLFSIYK
jgi:hypothetical protein